jgi:hypothetical protein
MREAIFTSCYMSLSNFGSNLSRKIFQSDSHIVSFFGSIIVGVVGTLSSHPFDTIATVAQKNELSMINSAKRIFNKRGLRGFYLGATWRFVLFTSAMLVIPTYQKLLASN